MTIRHQFLTIIAERLLELDTEHDQLKSYERNALNLRRIEWNRKTYETNLKWRACLLLGRFATIDELKAEQVKVRLK